MEEPQSRRDDERREERNVMSAAPMKVPVPALHLQTHDGDPVQGTRFTGYRLNLFLDGEDGRLELTFPTADRAGEAAERIREVLPILNRALAHAFGTRNDVVPDAAGCRHTVRIERGLPADTAIAVCGNCTTVLVHDVEKWIHDNKEFLNSRGFGSAAAAISYAAEHPGVLDNNG